jgi:hypothetical protein
MITSNANSFYFEGDLFLTNYLKNNNVSIQNNNLTVISDAFYLWIPQHVFHLPDIYKTFFDSKLSRTQQSLLIVDAGFLDAMHRHNKQGNLLHSIYDTNSTKKLVVLGKNQYNHSISVYLYKPKV